MTDIIGRLLYGFFPPLGLAFSVACATSLESDTPKSIHLALAGYWITLIVTRQFRAERDAARWHEFAERAVANGEAFAHDAWAHRTLASLADRN